MNQYDPFVNELAQAIRAYKPMPAFPEGLTLDEAYSILPKVAARACDQQVRGLKAGLTNPDMAALFGLDSALLGLLYDWGECQQNTVISVREHSQIECEIGICLDSQGKPLSIGPAIEIVHLDFSKPEDFNAPNLVVCGLGADRFICGDQEPWEQVDFDALRRVTIRLFRNGELVVEASPYDSLDGPENAIAWCLAEAARRDIAIAQNAIVLTGTCGSSTPMTAGGYVADYGPLGRVAFEIADCEPGDQIV